MPYKVGSAVIFGQKWGEFRSHDFYFMIKAMERNPGLGNALISVQ